jgi:hypothetical protein
MTFIACVPSYATYPTPVLFALIHLFCLAQSLLYWGTILFRCAACQYSCELIWINNNTSKLRIIMNYYELSILHKEITSWYMNELIIWINNMKQYHAFIWFNINWYELLWIVNMYYLIWNINIIKRCGIQPIPPALLIDDNTQCCRWHRHCTATPLLSLADWWQYLIHGIATSTDCTATAPLRTYTLLTISICVYHSTVSTTLSLVICKN